MRSPFSYETGSEKHPRVLRIFWWGDFLCTTKARHVSVRLVRNERLWFRSRSYLQFYLAGSNKPSPCHTCHRGTSSRMNTTASSFLGASFHATIIIL